MGNEVGRKRRREGATCSAAAFRDGRAEPLTGAFYSPLRRRSRRLAGFSSIANGGLYPSQDSYVFCAEPAWNNQLSSFLVRARTDKLC
jgi:hypothetical protein